MKFTLLAAAVSAISIKQKTLKVDTSMYPSCDVPDAYYATDAAGASRTLDQQKEACIADVKAAMATDTSGVTSACVMPTDYENPTSPEWKAYDDCVYKEINDSMAADQAAIDKIQKDQEKMIDTHIERVKK